MFGLLIITAIIAYVALIRLILKKAHDRLIKYSLLIAVIAIPFGDEIIGRVYFEYLCTAKTDMNVYQTVALPPSYWESNGEPNFIEANGNYHLEGYPPQRKYRESYPHRYRSSEYSSIFHIDERVVSIVNRKTGVVLGDVTNFAYWGGWLRRMISPHISANSCRESRRSNNELELSIFKQND
jgi:hypothetical protein